MSSNGRFLQHSDGRPFFYLGDTAWELFHRLSREEAARYLEDRRSKGFTVIQAVVLAEQGGLSIPNFYGHLPLIDRDPLRPDVRSAQDDYWDHVDHVLSLARDKGLHVALLPTWGDKVEKLWGGDGEPIFTEDNARSYGRFLGDRYKDQPNLIWVLGGDRGPNAYDIGIWKAMARGLQEGDGGGHLKTYHPGGEKSASLLLHDDPLFDFTMLQSGHCLPDEPAAEMVAADYRREPAKPVIDAEPRYEDHPRCFDPDKGWWDVHDVRHSAFLQTFSGAFGHTYGNHNIWQFFGPDTTPVSWARTHWPAALQQPGASQVANVRRLLESRPSLTRIPDSKVVRPHEVGDGLVRAARDEDGSYVLVYASAGDPFSVDLRPLTGTRVRAWWYDPRTGRATEPWMFDNDGESVDFDPPGAPGRTNDQVLVLDDAAFDYAPPGGPPSASGTAGGG